MARYRIDGVPGVLETAADDDYATWNGWSVPKATPTEIGRYLYDRAFEMDRSEWVECLFDFAAEYLVEVDVPSSIDPEVAKGIYTTPFPSDQERNVDGFTWQPVSDKVPEGFTCEMTPNYTPHYGWSCEGCTWQILDADFDAPLGRGAARMWHDEGSAP